MIINGQEIRTMYTDAQRHEQELWDALELQEATEPNAGLEKYDWPTYIAAKEAQAAFMSLQAEIIKGVLFTLSVVDFDKYIIYRDKLVNGEITYHQNEKMLLQFLTN